MRLVSKTDAVETISTYIDLFTQKERRPNTLRDRKRAEPLERKNGISRARAIPGKKVTGRERGKGEGWAGQKAHDGGLGDGVAEASRALSEAVVAVLSASRGIH